MKYACQVILVLMWGFWFFSTIRADIRGSPAREPRGEVGVFITILASAVSFGLWWFAGPLREFFR